jgi:hypothetical protein
VDAGGSGSPAAPNPAAGDLRSVKGLAGELSDDELAFLQGVLDHGVHVAGTDRGRRPSTARRA